MSAHQHNITISISEDEVREWREAAWMARKSLSAWVRERVKAGIRMGAQGDIKAVREEGIKVGGSQDIKGELARLEAGHKAQVKRYT